MTAKKSKTSQGLRTMLRPGRFATKFTPGGREKKPKRPMPSLPKLKCLETSDLKLEDGQQ